MNAWGRWIVVAAVAAMVAVPGSGAARSVRPVFWSVPSAYLPGHLAGTAFAVKCRIGPRPNVVPTACVVDSGDLSNGLLISEDLASWWEIKATGKTSLEGVTGTVSVPTGTTTIEIGSRLMTVRVVIDPFYHGFALIGPSVLRKIGRTMTLNFRTGAISFSGALVSTGTPKP